MNEDKEQAEEFASSPVIVDNKPSKEKIAKQAREKVQQIQQRPTEPSSVGQQFAAQTSIDPTEKVLKQDVARQREGRNPDDVMDEIVSSGKPVRFGDNIISPVMIKQARPERGNITNNDGYLRMRSIIFGEEGPKTGVILPQVKDNKPFIPDTVAEKYHGYVPKWKRQSLARIYVDNNLK